MAIDEARKMSGGCLLHFVSFEILMFNFQQPDEVGGFDTKPFAKIKYFADRGFVSADLNHRNIGSVDPAFEGQILLAHSSLYS